MIQSLHLRGAKDFTEHEIKKLFTSQPSRQFSHSALQQDVLTVKQMYAYNGYYAAAVAIDSVHFTHDSSFVSIYISVHEGKKSYLDVIVVDSNRVLTDGEILSAFSTQPGKVPENDILEADIQSLVKRYESLGYPFATVEVSEIGHLPNDSLKIHLLIDEGEQVTIEEIRIEGNTSTNNDVILRETRFQLPSRFDQEKISGIRNRLRRLGIFSRVDEPLLYLRNTTGGLLVKVEEGPTNTFDGVIGYLPSGTENAGGFVAGFVTIAMNNLFGTARSARIAWQKDSRNSQEVNLSYKEPWIFNFPVNVEGIFFQRQHDTVYLRRDVEGKIHIQFDEHLTVGGLINHEVIIPTVSSGAPLVSNSRLLTAGIEVRYDTRDDIISPMSGIHYRSDYRIGSKKIFSAVGAASGTSSVQRASVDVQYFAPVFSRNILMIGLHGRQITNSQIEVSDFYRFGGTHTVRGYREYEFTGSRIAWTNMEYRFLLARRSFFYGFFDTGYYFLPPQNNGSIPSQQNVKYGYGIGIRLETSLGNLGVSFALGEGNAFSEGKIHFGLINEF